jgi:hypothetical protein
MRCPRCRVHLPAYDQGGDQDNEPDNDDQDRLRIAFVDLSQNPVRTGKPGQKPPGAAREPERPLAAHSGARRSRPAGTGSGSMGKFFEPVAEDAILLQRDAELFGFRAVALPSRQQ